MAAAGGHARGSVIMNHLEYLVGHGAIGAFGRFRSTQSLPLARGDRVVLRTGRGLELGAVLRPLTAQSAVLLPGPSAGDLLRPAGADDERMAASREETARALLSRAEDLAARQDLPIALLDAEVLLDGEHAFLYHLCWGEADLRSLVAPLSRQFDLAILLEDQTTQESPGDSGACGSGGCGSGGCGSGGCGSGGGCATGCGAASPKELEAYFSSLREKMDPRRVPLL